MKIRIVKRGRKIIVEEDFIVLPGWLAKELKEALRKKLNEIDEGFGDDIGTLASITLSTDKGFSYNFLVEEGEE